MAVGMENEFGISFKNDGTYIFLEPQENNKNGTI